MQAHLTVPVSATARVCPRGADSAAKGGARERGVARQRRSTTRDRGLSGCERAQIPASKRGRPLCKELNRQECALEAVLARLADGKDSHALKVRACWESAFAGRADRGEDGRNHRVIGLGSLLIIVGSRHDCR